MMKKLLFLLTFLLPWTFIYPQVTFLKQYNYSGHDTGYDVLQTSDGGYIMVGQTSSTSGSAFIIRTNQYGDTLWTRAYGGNLSQVFSSIKKTSDSNFIVCGRTYGLGFSACNYLLIKINANGDTLWQKAYGGYSDDDANGVIQTSDGGYAITGVSCSFGQGFASIYFVKTDSNGNTLWTKTYDRYWANYGWDLKQLDDNGYILLGTIKKTSTGDNWDIHVIRTNENGDTLWTKVYGGIARDDACSIIKTNDGGFIIVGCTKSYGVGGYDSYIIKINSSGIIEWSKTYGGINDDITYKGISTSDNSFAIVGRTASFGTGGEDVYLIKIDSNGDTLWTRTFGSNWDDLGCDLQQTIDGGFIIAGWSNNWYQGYDYKEKALLIKTNSFGHVVGIADNALPINNALIFPNPTKGKVNILIPQQFGQTKTLEIFDCRGQLQLKRADNFTEIDVSSLTSGLYFIVLTNFDNDRLTSKIIKE